MTKELIQLWLDKGFEIYGVNAFYKKVNKYYPAYIDDRGIQHQEREVTMFQTIQFDAERQAFKVFGGVIDKGVYIPTKIENAVVSSETLRLRCKTAKELGWK